MMNFLQGSLILLFCLGVLPTGSAQKVANRLSEEEVSEQGMFIEAKRRKLLGDVKGATELFELILEKYRNNDVAAYELAEIYMIGGDYPEAVRLSNLALGIDPTNEWYHLLKGEIAKRQDDFEGVAEVYDVLYKRDPTKLDYLHNRGLFLAKANQFEDAIKTFEEVEQKTGVTERTALLRYELWKKAGKEKKATQALQQLIKASPKNVNYQHHLASHLNRMGKTAQAQDVYQGILALDPDDARANVAMASTYRKQGDESNYLQSIKPIVQNPDTDIDLKIAELMPYVREIQRNPKDDKVGPLLDLLSDLENAHPQDAKASSIHADVLSIAGRQMEAMEKYKRTIDLNPSNYLVWEQYLSALADQGMMTKLLAESETALDFFPNQAFIHYCNGLANASMSSYEHARSALDQALMMAGKDNEMRVSIFAMQGHVYRNLAMNDKAEQAFEEALTLDASDPRLLNDYAYHLANTRQKLKEAEGLANKALDRRPNDPRFLGTLAWIHFKKGEINLAMDTMAKSISNGGNRYGYLNENFGDILFVSEDVDAAVEHWKTARELGISSNSLERKIQERRIDDAQ